MIIASFPKGSFPENSWPVGTWPAAFIDTTDIQYTEVMEFAVCIAASADFDVVLPNDASVGVVSTDIVVSGAGDGYSDDTYSYGGTYLDKPVYAPIGSSKLIAWYGTFWDINGRYISTEDVATPDLVTTWTAYGLYGVDPVPTVTAPTVSTLTEVAAFTLEMPTVIEIEVYEELHI